MYRPRPQPTLDQVEIKYEGTHEAVSSLVAALQEQRLIRYSPWGGDASRRPDEWMVGDIVTKARPRRVRAVVDEQVERWGKDDLVVRVRNTGGRPTY